MNSTNEKDLPPANTRQEGVDNHYRTKVADLPPKNDIPPTETPSLAQPPIETAHIGIGAPSAVAAGMPAVLSTVKHAWKEMGIARSFATLLKVNQVDGFDCQSCAWPNPEEHRHVAEFCENGAKAVAEEATTKRITREFFRKHSVDAMGAESDYWLGKQGRLTEPMVLREGKRHYEPIPWAEAFQLIADELNALASPNEAIFYTSGRTSNEAAFLYQLFVRQFGTNNLPDCSNMCHESSGTALTETIGVGKGTVTLKDFESADAIFIIGQNPGTNHPRMMSTLQAAARRGCTIVNINPLPETGTTRFRNPQEVFSFLSSGTQLASLFLQIRINGDAALLQGMAKEMLEEEERRPGSVLDHEFIASKTVGFEEFAAGVSSVSWQRLVDQSGIARDQIRRAAQIAITSRATIVCWAMGLTQHKNAVATIQEIVNFLLLRGNIGRAGAGVCPVRGHSNVQGDRTMGIWERPGLGFLQNLEREFHFKPPLAHGHDTVGAIKAMHDGEGKVFLAMGGNFLSAAPDTEYTAQALRQTRLTAHVSTKLNRGHLITGKQALILPCLGRSERDPQQSGDQFVTVEDSMGVISPSRGVLPPASAHLLSETAIVARLARTTLGNRTSVPWEDLAANYDRIRDHIEHVIPGFEKYNDRVRKGPFVLPNSAREGEFKTDSGKAHFTAHSLPEDNLEEGQFVMMTVRSHDQFNTTIYGLDDRYRGIHDGRRVIFMNPEDVRIHGLQEGQLVDLTSHFEGSERTAKAFKVVPFSIPRRCTATYFPETNVLVPIRSVALKSNTPTSKYVVITVRPTDHQ